MKTTSYNKAKGDFDISWPGRVARHDLVYLAPPTDPMQYGMPIGNGDIGALVWCEDRKIIMAFNKCDLWDDASFGNFHIGSVKEAECSTSLRHACRIVIDFGIPLFDTLYLNDFKGRLRLQDGCIEMHLDGPFGTMDAEIFVTYEGSVLCARVKTDFTEDDGVRITLERYGSRTFDRWYVFRKRDTTVGLGGTESRIKDDCLMLSHKLTTGSFICALKPKGEGFKNARRTDHMVSSSAEKCPKEFTFYALTTSPLEEKENEDFALATLKKASERGFDALLSESGTCWKAFWEKSFIETDDDYLDNLWHLAMYYSCAGQRGRYPGRFTNSLWTWNRDIQPWNYYFHWNQQEVYWGLNAAGHHDLCDSYLNYRFNTMEHAREDAERLYGVKDGLFVADVSDRRGYNAEGGACEMNNHTPAGEIALDFWRQYLYTGDKEFLANKALPFMLGAARLFISLFVKEKDGKYHAKGGTCYEGRHVVYDPITEIAMANVLFDAVSRGMEIVGITDPIAEQMKEIKENITPIQMLDTDPRMVKDNGDGTGTILLGMFKGKTVALNKVFAMGRSEGNYNYGEMAEHHIKRLNDAKGTYIPQYVPHENTETEQKLLDGTEIVIGMLHEHYIPTNTVPEVERGVRAHPQANIAPIFPMGMIGIKDKGTDLYNTAVTTAMTSRDGQAMGWDPMPIALARLGLSDEVDAYIYDYPSLWQYYNNGFCHYGPNSVFFAEKVSPFRRDIVRNADDPQEKFWAETFPFRHMGLDPLGVFAAVMNERLMQSYDGVIRVATAYGKRNARFKLHAVGGFEVMCEICDGVPAFTAIRSLRGEALKFANPWDRAWCNGTEYTEDIIEIETETGETYLFTPDGSESFAFEPETPEANQDCKVRPDKNAMLGLARSF